MLDVPMNSVGVLIEDYKSAVASVLCVVAPVCNPLTYICPLVFGEYLRSVAALIEPVFALLCLRVDRDLPSICLLLIASVYKSMWQVVSSVLGSRIR